MTKMVLRISSDCKYRPYTSSAGLQSQARYKIHIVNATLPTLPIFQEGRYFSSCDATLIECEAYPMYN